VARRPSRRVSPGVLMRSQPPEARYAPNKFRKRQPTVSPVLYGFVDHRFHAPATTSASTQAQQALRIFLCSVTISSQLAWLASDGSWPTPIHMPAHLRSPKFNRGSAVARAPIATRAAVSLALARSCYLTRIVKVVFKWRRRGRQWPGRGTCQPFPSCLQRLRNLQPVRASVQFCLVFVTDDNSLRGIRIGFRVGAPRPRSRRITARFSCARRGQSLAAGAKAHG
jgi:hypothetical protein